MINLLTPPIFDDEDKTLASRHLFIIIWTFMVAGWLALIIAFIIPETLYRWLLVISVIESSGVILLVLNKHGRTRVASNLLLFIIWAVATGMALTGGGTNSNAISIYFIIVLIAGFLKSGKAGITTAILCSLTGLFLVYLERYNVLPANRVPHTPFTLWIANTIYMAVIISLQYLVSRTIKKALQQSRQELKERQKTDMALRKSEELYTQIVATMPDIMIRMSLKGEIIFVNEIGLNLSGYKVADLIGQNMFSFIAPEDHAKAAQNFSHMMEKRLGPQEYHLIMKDGRKLLFEVNGNVLRNEDGSPYGIVQVCRDITTRKQVEEDLRKSEANYRQLFDNSPAAIYQINFRTGKFLKANDILCEYLGCSQEEITSLSPYDSLTNDSKILFSERLEKMSLGEKVTENPEYEVVDKNGKRRWLQLNSKNIYDSEGLAGANVVAHDISERKQAEEEKRRMQEHLQHVDKMEAIGTLAGGIAHDFNNLLMGIQGYASLSLMNLDPAHPNYERLKRIEEHVQSGADLTNQLLGFARGGRYEVKPTDINDIIQKTSSMFGRTKKEITIHQKYEKDLRPVEVDRGQMEQVFLNLYVNSWQAMPGGGEIYLETENVFLSDQQAMSYSLKPGQYVKLSVTDTGTGMDEKTKERIFDPFFTTKTMGRGTGLGLATVYGIIKGHKGMINVYSEPGHGTTFSIYLPASDKEVVKEAIATEVINRGTETILLVDDEIMILEVNRELLEFMGYKVYTAGSGQEAMVLYLEKRNEIDLVILDMIMPEMSGGETFDRLREINPGIKILLSSGYSLSGEAQTIMGRGCNGFIQKPFLLEKLSGKVREMLDF